MKIWLKTQYSKNKYHGIQFHHFISIRWGNNRNIERFCFLGLQNHCRWWFSHKIKTHLHLGGKAMTNIDGILKSMDIALPTKVHLVKAMVFPVVIYGCESWTIKKAEHEELMLLNCGFGEDSWESLGLQPVHPKGDQSWVFTGRTDVEAENSNTLATWCEKLIDLKRPWCWERLRAGGEGDDRGWDGWMASPTWWTWVWVNSRSWWWTGSPGVLRFMGSQRVGHDWATELRKLWGNSFHLWKILAPMPPKWTEMTSEPF